MGDLGTDARQTIRDVAAALRIAHHVPGRVRLKLDGGGPSAAMLDGAKRFIRAAGGAPGIRSVNLNALARSCVVEYDPKIISPAAWRDLVGGHESADADALLGALVAAGSK